jgi:hypothetical protein
MNWMHALALSALLLMPANWVQAEIKRWRVGDGEHPWILTPVTGRLSWGRGWAVEIATDDDGDGLIDEDPVELIDNDGDGLINEDPPDPQIDNDGDGTLNEDPVDNRDNDGDGLIDEDPPEAFDNDLDGLIDEDGPDPQEDSDGDGRLNEDGLMTDGDNDYDGKIDEDPPNGVDDDGDGLIDEDGPRVREDPARGVTTWLRPIRLDGTRNLATLLNERYLQGELGGTIPGRDPLNPFMLVPSEYGFRNEGADPFSSDFEARDPIPRVDYVKMVDGDLTTAFGSAEAGQGGIDINLMGFYYINRIVFRPRPTLPQATIFDYWIRYGDPTTINATIQGIQSFKTLVPEVRGHFNPPVKDLRFDPPVLIGRIDLIRRVPRGIRVETAETGIYGQGFPLDASFTSAMIDVGTPRPRVRRYSRQIELFSASERSLFEEEFSPQPGQPVNWGKVRWRGRQLGKEGNVRIQFRVGNSLDTHLYARRLGPSLIDTRDEQGNSLDVFTWLKLAEGRVPEGELQYNELGTDLGVDGRQGWSFWSAPFKFEDGLIDERLPSTQWHTAGVPLPLPGGTRYLQFRVWFDSVQDSGVLLDFIEFDYDTPLVSGGVVAEIFPPQVPLGEETAFRYFVRPLFAPGEPTAFNRLEIEVPSLDSRIDTLRFDGQDWQELAVSHGGEDPLRPAQLRRLPPTPGTSDSLGQFAQAVVVNPSTGQPRLLVKLPLMDASNFRFDETLELVLRSRLVRASQEFASAVWNDQLSERASSIPQPVQHGDASPEVATDALLVVVEQIGRLLTSPRVQPNPFTPNGDGINDQVKISFDLFLLMEQVGIELDIFDLSGRQVRTLKAAGQRAGRIEVDWDGLDGAGQRLPPGLYLYRLSVDSDAASGQHSGLLALTY